MFFKTANGVNLLLFCEMSWCSLYTCYFLAASVLGTLTLIVNALPLLILASVDCGLWLLSLTYYNYLNKGADFNNFDKSTKFMFRAARLLKVNSYIL